MGYWPRKILLATDGTEDAPLAVLDVSSKSGAELYVVHAWQRETSEAYVLSMPSTSYGWREQRAGRLLDEQAEFIEEAGGVVAGSYLAAGEAPEEIAGLVEWLDADLLVVGRQEQAPVRRLANRGVSEEISSLVRCPVLVAKGGKGTWPPARIVEVADKEPGPPLVIVGSRGLEMLERLRDGSVSTRVMRGVDAPVLVCPRRGG